MKVISRISDIVNSVDGYKNQFVFNELPNLLLIDPQTSRFEFYTMILPSILLSANGYANIAFTKMQKYKSGPKREPINLTETEIGWANVIFFPFSAAEYQYTDEIESVHLFDKIRSINPSVKIILLHEVLIDSQKFIQNLIDLIPYSGQKPSKQKISEFKKFVEKGICQNIEKADKIIATNKLTVQDVVKRFPGKEVQTILPKNYNELIFEGFDNSIERLPFLSDSEIRVWVHFSSDKSVNEKFIKEVMQKAPEKVVFYSSQKVKESNHIYFHPMSISHWHKVNFTNRFEYQIFVSKHNHFEKASEFFEGYIVDGLFHRTAPIFTNKKMIPEGYLAEFADGDELIEKYFKIDHVTRVNINSKYFFELNNHVVNETEIVNYKSLFFDF